MRTVFVVVAIVQKSGGVELQISQAFETREQALEVYYRFNQGARQFRAYSVEIHELDVIPKGEN